MPGWLSIPHHRHDVRKRKDFQEHILLRSLLFGHQESSSTVITQSVDVGAASSSAPAPAPAAAAASVATPSMIHYPRPPAMKIFQKQKPSSMPYPRWPKRFLPCFRATRWKPEPFAGQRPERGNSWKRPSRRTIPAGAGCCRWTRPVPCSSISPGAS